MKEQRTIDVFIKANWNNYVDYTLIRKASDLLTEQDFDTFNVMISTGYHDKVDDVRYINGVDYEDFLKRQAIKLINHNDYIKAGDVTKHLNALEFCQWNLNSILFKVTDDILNATPLTLSQLL